MIKRRFAHGAKYFSAALGLGVWLSGLLGADEKPLPPREPEPVLEQLSPTRYKLGLLELDKSTREITFPAVINQTNGVLEYAIVHETGKVHESLLRTDARPFHLKLALLLLNYKEQPTWFVPPTPPKPLDTVSSDGQSRVAVRWKTASGTEHTAPLESWVRDVATRKAALPGPWVFSGSHFNEENQFAAEVDGSLVALYLDARCLLNNPRPGNADDERWEPMKGMPAKGTAVTVILQPVSLPSK